MAVIHLRKAEEGDCLCVWRWRNEKEVRQFSSDARRIPYAAHRIWFLKKIAFSETALLIGETGAGDAFGQVRLDERRNGTAELHIMVARKYRNQGLGQRLLEKACHYGFRRMNLKKILAHVLVDNPRSIHLFEKAGFARERVVRRENQSLWLMKKTRDSSSKPCRLC